MTADDGAPGTAHASPPADEPFTHVRYPAPGRTQQPMPSTPSPWPWVVAGGVITLLTVLTPIVLYVVMSGHPR